jgi:hypothetical protein
MLYRITKIGGVNLDALFWGLTRQGVRHVTIVVVFQEKAELLALSPSD